MTTNTKTTTTPAFISFTAALVQAAAELGLPKPVTAETETGLPQNKGFVFLRFAPDGAALIIPKSVKAMAKLDSHLDLSGHDGYLNPVDSNGRVICQFAPDVDKVKAILPLFVEASKRPVKKASKVDSAAASAATPDTADGEAELASWSPSDGETEAASWAEEDMTDEELDAATQPLMG